MANHNYNFEGGEILTKIGASWFISYAYYLKIDSSHKNWEKIAQTSCERRKSRFTRSKKYHDFWLNEIKRMNPDHLDNEIGLSGKDVIRMAKML